MRPARTTRFLLLLSFAVACNSLESPTTAPVQVPLRPGAAIGADCSDCVFGPETFVRLQGRPTEFTRTLTGVAAGTYTIDVDELGSMGADGSVVLNGQIILDTRAVTGEVGPRHITATVQLSGNDVLEVRLLGRKGSVLQIAIRPAVGGDCLPDLPAPQLVVESGVIDGFGNNMYDLAVTNYASFPDYLFSPAPDLEPCGLNTNSPRTWVEIFSGDDDTRLFGFCNFSEAVHLNTAWFVVQPGETVPQTVYMTLTDRKCGITYTSNKADVPQVIIQ
ncbi:MAG: hypothetical protein K0S86_2878 [Geminicoccaceae bacterium]|jgi:hypothetical protein|nr:hypothetical protein [Geminicoccaceae bacterium]